MVPELIFVTFSRISNRIIALKGESNNGNYLVGL